MTEARSFVVGADSRIGFALMLALEASGRATIGTTRRRHAVASTRVFLDLSDDVEGFEVPSGVDTAYLLAATTGIERCENDPTSWTVNVASATKLAARLLQQGCFVTFLSTNAVFGGDRPRCDEDDPVAPIGAYARQKAEAERAIREAADRLSAANRLNVIRLTKTFALDTPPLPDWFRELELGNVIRPFADCVISPISLGFVTRSLLRTTALGIPGIVHLSGERDVTYAEFADALIAAFGLPRGRAVPTTSTVAGVAVPFHPQYAGLGMRRATQLAGIYPEPLEQVVRYLVEMYREAKRATNSGDLLERLR